jgi:hypothetical protein
MTEREKKSSVLKLFINERESIIRTAIAIKLCINATDGLLAGMTFNFNYERC